MDVAPRFQFEGFTLDLMRRALRSGDREIELRPKSFDLLCYLVERHGRLAAKDDIFQAVWPNVAVTDDSVVQCVKDIRQALGDSDQRIVKTVPGRGYVFAAPVSIGADVVTAVAPPPQQAPVRPMRPLRWTAPRPLLIGAAGVLIVAGAVLLTVSVGLWPAQPSGLPLPDRPSIAVLPFANMSGDAKQDYFSDGISQDLTTDLSKFGELFVIAYNSALKYKGREITTAQIGRELGVRYLLQGSVRKDAERLRITAQLIDASSGAQIWAEHYDRNPAGIFAVQDDVTQKIVVRLVASIDRSELNRTLRKPPEAWAAHDHYLRGNALMRRGPRDSSGTSIAAARSAFEQSLAIDPRYAQATRGLAATYLAEWLHPALIVSPHKPVGREVEHQAALDNAALLAQQAIDLDPTLAEAYADLGYTLFWQRGPTPGLKVFERVFEINPNHMDGRFAVVLSHSGRAPQAVDFMKRMMRLDPFYPPTYTYYLGKSYFFAGQYAEALEQVKAAADRLPGLRPVLPMYAAAAALSGGDEEAREAVAQLRKIQPNFTISDFVRFMRLDRKQDKERLAEGLRKAGLPE